MNHDKNSPVVDMTALNASEDALQKAGMARYRNTDIAGDTPQLTKPDKVILK